MEEERDLKQGNKIKRNNPLLYYNMDPLTITGLAVGSALGALVIGGIGTAVFNNKIISRKRRTRVSDFSSRSQGITTRRLSTSIPRGKRSHRVSSIAEGKGRSRKNKQ